MNDSVLTRFSKVSVDREQQEKLLSLPFSSVMVVSTSIRTYLDMRDLFTIITSTALKIFGESENLFQRKMSFIPVQKCFTKTTI